VYRKPHQAMISVLPGKLLRPNQVEVALRPKWLLSELDRDFNNIRVRSFILTGAPDKSIT
jgi:hypothetical protein